MHRRILLCVSKKRDLWISSNQSEDVTCNRNIGTSLLPFYDYAADRWIFVFLRLVKKRDIVIAWLTAAKLPPSTILSAILRFTDETFEVVKRIPPYFVAFPSIRILFVRSSISRE